MYTCTHVHMYTCKHVLMYTCTHVLMYRAQQVTLTHVSAFVKRSITYLWVTDTCWLICDLYLLIPLSWPGPGWEDLTMSSGSRWGTWCSPVRWTNIFITHIFHIFLWPHILYIFSRPNISPSRRQYVGCPQPSPLDSSGEILDLKTTANKFPFLGNSWTGYSLVQPYQPFTIIC